MEWLYCHRIFLVFRHYLFKTGSLWSLFSIVFTLLPQILLHFFNSCLSLIPKDMHLTLSKIFQYPLIKQQCNNSFSRWNTENFFCHKKTCQILIFFQYLHSLYLLNSRNNEPFVFQFQYHRILKIPCWSFI